MKTRRDLLKTAAAIPAAATAQHVHPTENLVQIARPSAPQAFDAARFRLLTRLVDLIIPRSDTPGAADAGVPLLIDAAAKQRAEVRQRFEKGLDGLDRQARAAHQKPFVELAEAQQVAILRAASNEPSSEAGRFFQLTKDMTIDGYYTSRPGLEQELGWHGNTFLPAFPGCTHPEHQA
jgi:hypothetical protein